MLKNIDSNFNNIAGSDNTRNIIMESLEDDPTPRILEFKKTKSQKKTTTTTTKTPVVTHVDSSNYLMYQLKLYADQFNELLLYVFTGSFY